MRKRRVVIVGFYALLALLALYNPLFHLSTHITGWPTTDFYHFHWNYWWMRHALSSGQSIYLTNYVFAPFTNNLAFHTLTPFFYPIWALLEPLVGTVAAMTTIFVVAMTASAAAFYALLRRERVAVGLALVGGAMLELTPIMFTGVYWTNINLMGWFWLPLLLLIWGAITRATGRRLFLNSLLLGLVLWGIVLTDLQYPLWDAFVIVPYVLLTLWRAGSARARLRLLIAGGAALALALILLWFAGPLPYILSFDRGDLAPTPAERAVSVPFPLGFIWHYDPDRTGHVSVGAVLLPLIGVALLASWWHRRQRRAQQAASPAIGGAVSRWFWLALMPLPLVLAAGASVTVFGATIPLPYQLLHALFGGMFRYPERFVPVALIPGVLFAMRTLTPLLAPRRRLHWLAPALLLFLVIADSRMLEPFPIQPLPTPYSFYKAIGQEPYDEVIVEVPTAAMSGEGIVGEARFVVTQFYGLTHGKRMINGHISRVPISHYWYMRTDDPMLAWLGQRRFIEPDVVEQQMRERIFSYPIGYFVIHRDWIGGVGSVTDQEILGYFNSLRDLVCPLWIEGDALVYRTAWHPDGCPARVPPQDQAGAYVIDIGAADDVRYIGWGWHQAEDIAGITWRWTGEYPQTQLYFDLPPGAYDLTLRAQAFYEPRHLRLLLNDQPVGEPVMVAVEPLADYRFHIPAALVGDGQHLRLTLDYDATVVPAQIGQGSDTRRLAVTVDTVTFAPTS